MFNVYYSTIEKLKNSHNQPAEMIVSDLIEELESQGALDQELAWQMKLAIMHYCLSSESSGSTTISNCTPVSS